jgi:hypothetical protein
LTESSLKILDDSLDDSVASVLPALTSVSVQKPSVISENVSKTSNLTTFDQILQHQYKIKGLDKDYEDERYDQYEKHQKENEKLIGVLGSQV